MIKSLPLNAGDMGSIPDQGTKIPHALEQLSPHGPKLESMHCKERSYMRQQRS